MPCKKGERKHTPITTKKQAAFFGAEYGRAKAGKTRRSSIKKADLKSHLEEWGKTHTTLSPNLVGHEHLFNMVHKP